MNISEKQIENILIELKENGARGIKAEFAQEGASFDEVLKLKNFADCIDLPLTLKIGGCEAVKDMKEALSIGAENIVAPMIESVYASKKYIDNIKNVFNSASEQTFFINIETKPGVEVLKEILKTDVQKIISGVVFGRTDMAESLECDDVNNEIILDYAKKISQICFDYNREFIIGGGISTLSVPFLSEIYTKYLTKFETRKIIFDAKSIVNPKISEVISKAIEFEILWIKYKKRLYGKLSAFDEERIITLESRFYTVK